MEKASTRFFEKKRGKKLLLISASGVATPEAEISKSFLLLFFKKEALSCLASCNCVKTGARKVNAMAREDVPPSPASHQRRDIFQLCAAVSLMFVPLLLANGLSAHFPELFGASLPAISGATIIGLSIVVTGALLVSAAVMLRRSAELRRLLDDLDDADLVLSRAESTAARIRRFKARAEPQKTLG